MPRFDSLPDDLQDSSVATASIPPSPPAPERQTSGVTERKRQSRLTIPLDTKGNIEWDRLKPDAANELKATIKSDKTVSKLFDKDSIEAITIETAATVIDGLAKINTFVFMKVFHLHPAVAIQSFTYSSEQHELADPRMAIVLNRYKDKLPDWIIRYQDVIQLGSVLMQITKEQITAAFIMQKGINERMAAEAEQNKQHMPAKPNGSDSFERI